MANPYCEFIKNKGKGTVHETYHNNEYGFPIDNDNDLFERFVLEINQAGLSWETILKKKENFYIAFDNFDIKKISQYDEKKFNELMNNSGIVRNRLKINAAIENAKRIVSLQKEFGSFKNWLDAHHPKTKEEWTKLFKRTFKFTGGEIVNEFLMSTGYLPGSHSEDCLIYKQVLKQKPKWTEVKK